MLNEQITILIVDDHPLFRKGLRALLTTVPELTVIGEAATGDEAIHLVEQLQPNVVLMDLQMPNGDGVTATRRIAETHPEVRILVVTMFQDEDSVFTAMRAGARGYILKDMPNDDMIRAILAVGRGNAIFSPTIATRIMAFLTATAGRPDAVFPQLTESERNVLHLMAQGVNNQSIAEQLALSPKTVRNYISTIFSKLHVADRAQAIMRAREAGLK